MNAQAMRRRLFLGTAVGALALGPSRTAQADTTFTNFSFAATGAPTARTMPDRLNDVTNVKDWGATGNGRTDDAPAIQAAIDAAIAAGGGTVWFPTGDYVVYSPLLTWRGGSTALRLLGAGKGASQIRYTGPGWTITHDPRNPDGTPGGGESVTHIEGLRVDNGSLKQESGAIRLAAGSANATIRGCDLGGFKCVDMAGRPQLGDSGTFGTSIHDCSLNGPQQNRADSSIFAGAQPGSIGVCLGEGIMTDCRIMGYDIAIAMSQNGSSVIGCSGEGNNIFIRVGKNAHGDYIMLGFTIQGCQTERNYVDIDIGNGVGGLVAGNFTSGAFGPATHAPIENMTWANGQVTVTTPGPHNIAVGRKIRIEASPTWGDVGDWVVTAVPSPTTFKYALPIQPTVPFGGNKIWNYRPLAPLRIRSCGNTAFMGNIWHPHGEFGSADFASTFSGGPGQIRAVSFIGETFPSGITVPDPTSLARSGLNFHQCFGVTPFMRFVDLPKPSNLALGFEVPHENMQFTIIDGQKQGGGVAGWNDIVTGGGSGHYLVRYNGANWRRIA
jgi:hypothetical protein